MGLSYDVGIDNREFLEYYCKPINLYELCEIMYKKYIQIEEEKGKLEHGLTF